MSRSRLFALVPLSIFIAVSARADQPTLSLAGVELGSSVRELEAQVIPALERGLLRAGAKLKTTRDTANLLRQPICETDECAREVGTRLGVTFIAFAQIDSSPSAFTITVKIMRSIDGAELSRESLTCGAADPCSPIPQSAREVATEAGRKAKGRLDEPALPVPPQPAPPPEVAEVEPIPAVPEPVAAPVSEQTQHDLTATPAQSKTHIAPGWFVASAVVATGAIVAGTVMIGLDGVPVETTPAKTTYYSDGKTGIALVSGGALLMAASAYGYLRWGRDTGAPTVALTHDSIGIAGRF